MSDTCQTVRIVADNEQGFSVINESDFDPAVHTLYEEAIQATAKKQPKKAPQ